MPAGDVIDILGASELLVVVSIRDIIINSIDAAHAVVEFREFPRRPSATPVGCPARKRQRHGVVCLQAMCKGPKPSPGLVSDLAPSFTKRAARRPYFAQTWMAYRLDVHPTRSTSRRHS